MTRIDPTNMKELLKVYFISGSNNCLKQLEEVLEEAIKGGITLFQFREKGTNALKGDDRTDLAKRLFNICKQYNVPFIVNDDIELALAINADGVHIGQDDGCAEEVRKRIGDKLLGVSAHSEKEVQLASQAGADYVGIGPIFSTSTKEDAKAARGTSLIKELRKKGYDIPIVGIGGITTSNAAPVIEAGADGVSVITAISLTENSFDAARQLKQEVTMQGGVTR
ncbi:thiamine-phosphate pyrophosphorylase [Bacillus sp. FJAT-18017]|uniref:thiamine phosphate synthase n=1 Tax=Bacillus sp. FJAT-18017 TaxID=1705566 RepID=UPI0006AE0077|nr:thiamine phosphate synthase [Bacillus sp. FJAT-18017]ALC90733.1 thiamine-phosphate pyrophosphorylase [Bacillus sp. FJAT-18017]